MITIKLRLYHVKESYINYLHGTDSRVQLNKGERRPYVGIVLSVNNMNYFVPMESPKPNHVNLKTGIHLMKIDGGKYGLLGFNNMIPVRGEALLPFDINAEPDTRYRELLRNQIAWCNKNSSKIMEHADKTYRAVKEGKNAFILKISCDFQKLEAAAKRYNPNYKKKSR